MHAHVRRAIVLSVTASVAVSYLSPSACHPCGCGCTEQVRGLASAHLPAGGTHCGDGQMLGPSQGLMHQRRYMYMLYSSLPLPARCTSLKVAAGCTRRGAVLLLQGTHTDGEDAAVRRQFGGSGGGGRRPRQAAERHAAAPLPRPRALQAGAGVVQAGDGQGVSRGCGG